MEKGCLLSPYRTEDNSGIIWGIYKKHESAYRELIIE